MSMYQEGCNFCMGWCKYFVKSEEFSKVLPEISQYFSPVSDSPADSGKGGGGGGSGSEDAGPETDPIHAPAVASDPEGDVPEATPTGRMEISPSPFF